MAVRLACIALSLLLGSLAAATAGANAASPGTLSCGSDYKRLMHHEISWEDGGNKLRVAFATSSVARPELVFDIDLEARDGGAVKKQLRAYDVTATCAGRSWHVSRQIGEGARQYDDFKTFEVSYRENGHLVLYNQGRHDDVSWNVGFHAPLKKR